MGLGFTKRIELCQLPLAAALAATLAAAVFSLAAVAAVSIDLPGCTSILTAATAARGNTVAAKAAARAAASGSWEDAENPAV